MRLVIFILDKAVLEYLLLIWLLKTQAERCGVVSVQEVNYLEAVLIPSPGGS